MIHDITLELFPRMVRWEGDAPMKVRRMQDIEKGDPYNLSMFQMSVHQGTHIDAPNHFISDGDLAEAIPLERFMGRAQVLEFGEDLQLISADDLRAANIEEGIERLLFKTRNSGFWKSGSQEFQRDYTALSLDGAQYLCELGVKLVGIDYLSISPFGDSTPVHKCLLAKGIVILEAIDLSQVKAGSYTLVCLPLKLKQTEGAPVRAILLDEDSSLNG